MIILRILTSVPGNNASLIKTFSTTLHPIEQMATNLQVNVHLEDDFNEIIKTEADIENVKLNVPKSIPKTPKLSYLISRSPQMIGLLSLITVISLWLLASILTQDILKDYNKPALMTFMSVISMQVYFVFLKVKDPLFEFIKSKSDVETKADVEAKTNSSTSKPSEPITIKQTAKFGLMLFSIYFLNLYFVNASLKYTTLGSSSILCATCSFFTIFLGSVLKVERFTLIKGLVVLITFIGVVVNSLPSAMRDSLAVGTQTWGNILALLAAISYALFLILLQKQTDGKSGLNRSILFAFIGLFTMIFFWPIFFLLSLSGQETLELPSRPSIYWYLLLKVLLESVIPCYLWNVAFALTSPVYVAVGTSMTIPLNFIADYFLGHGLGWMEAVAAVLVTFGCLIMNLTEL